MPSNGLFTWTTNRPVLEYGEFALCNVNNGHWITWNNKQCTTILMATDYSVAESEATFFTQPWCGKPLPTGSS